jgi:hypothetical protein
MFTRVLAIWLLLLIVAVLNGGIREILITPRFGEQGGHILSTAILCAVITLVAWLAIAWIAPNNGREALLVRIAWVALTLAFEFVAGHYVFGNSWERLLADYTWFAAAFGFWCSSLIYLRRSGLSCRSGRSNEEG